MQPLKTYEVTLRQMRIFTRTVRVDAMNPEDARTLALYAPGYSFSWSEDENAESVHALDAREVDLEKAKAHYAALNAEAKATIPGMEAEA